MEDIKIIIDTNAEQAGKSFDDLGKKFKDTTNDAEDLRKQIRGLKDELYKLEPGTKEYTDTLQELGAKMDQLSDTQQELRVATGGLDTVFETTTQATATLAAGFTAASGVIALFGGNTEDLQKTFVKLQATMAILNGLKGFAALPKTFKRAIISVKAYTTEIKAATASTNVFSASLKKMGTALVSNPWVAALAVLAAAFAYTAKEQKEATELTEAYNKAIGASPAPIKTAEEQLDDYLETLEKYDQKLSALGISEERRREIKLEGLKSEKEETEKLIEANKERIEELEAEIDAYQQSIEDQVDNFDELDVALATMPQAYEKQSQEIKKLKKETAELSPVVEKLTKDIESLENVMDPPVLKSLNEALSSLSDEYTVKMAGGLATQGDYLQAQIDVYKKAQSDLYKVVGSHNGRSITAIIGDTLEERKANEELSTRFSAEIHGLQVQLDAYNASVAKKTRDAAQRLAESLKENYEELIKQVKNEATGITDKWNEVMSSLDFSTFTLLPKEERSGRLSAQALRFEAEIDNYLETWSKLADKAKTEGKITEKQFNDFTASLNNIKSELENSIEIKFDTNNISDEVRKIGESIQNSIADIKLDNENMLKALSAGLISKEEYQEWLVKQMQEYKQITNQVVETSNPFEEAFINASKAIIPPEVETQMKSEIEKYYNNIIKEIDKGFDKIENRYEWRRDRFDLWMEDQNRSWIEGGTETSYWGDSATAIYNKMKEQNEELFNLLHEQYQEEIAFLEEKVAALDGNVEAQEEYNNQIAALREADSDALHAKNTADLAAMRQYGQNVMDMAGKFGDAISGLASAMGSYYGEQAEQAKEMYGENSEEYKKYLKKEGNMKIAQVWTDAATGIMTAWATSEQLGPIAGPILAAVQTAALLATATASTMQIKRQTNANASGGETTANVGQLTDRVIMAEAQNTDQTAQLNAEYSQGATRVFVTVDDINSGQDANRTAVTNNRF